MLFRSYAIARDILDSGRALEKMRAIIQAQGSQTTVFKPGTLTFEITAPSDGVVTAIDNLQLAKIARMAGAPMDKGAGVDLLHKLGAKVAKDEPLYRVHAEFQADYQFAENLARQNSGYTIGTAAEVTRTYMEV